MYFSLCKASATMFFTLLSSALEMVRANELSDQLEYKEQHAYLQLAMDTVGELDWYTRLGYCKMKWKN